MGMKLYCQFEDDEQINLAALQLFLFLFSSTFETTEM